MQFIKLTVFIVFLGFLLWALFVQDPYPYFGSLLGNWLHIPSFFVFSLLSYWLLRAYFSILFILSGVAVLSILLEVAQPIFQPLRQFEVADIMLNFIGILLAYLILRLVISKLKFNAVDDVT